jgi:hypothetical protein
MTFPVGSMKSNKKRIAIQKKMAAGAAVFFLER